ncbi:MAG: MBL fold metallo-hydrolase [Candidatus Krumholzibacteriota bacterium]|nr:MBL fold metallo-hydrolase [Candidatus Krumholzibacteriota bacterium]
MLLKHFFMEKIAHSSYLLAGSNACAIVDPRRDVDLYIEAANQQGVEITHILETHLHADFISGHLDLAARTGAKIYAPRSGNCSFDHEALSAGDEIEIENILIKVLETPGHTPEHISYVVMDRSRGDQPAGVFSGDTLFVGDVGRPDLFPDIAIELAGKLHHSLHHQLLKLPDFCEVWPCHGAGSLCGRAMGAKWRSTIGYERLYNSALRITDRDEFIKSLTRGMPPTPDHFSRCSDINRQGPARVVELPVLARMSPAGFREAMKSKDVIVLDVRSYEGFGSHHIPGAWHIDISGNFPTFAGWVLPPDKRILLVAATAEEAHKANIWARRVGLDRVFGYLDKSMFGWATSGFQTSDVRQISAETLHNIACGKHERDEIVLVDVRSALEFNDNHIEGALNIPAPEMRTRFRELHPDKHTVLICSTGHRSSLASSILKRQGFHDVANVAGGMTGYSAAGYTKSCKVCANPHGSRFYDSFVPVQRQWGKSE